MEQEIHKSLNLVSLVLGGVLKKNGCECLKGKAVNHRLLTCLHLPRQEGDM